jgi:indole-3-glycerol phosphate synthase
MTSVLDSIIAGVLQDVEARALPIADLRRELEYAPHLRDAYAALASPGMQIIAEVKRASPSKGSLAVIADPADLAISYQSAGAAVISVLTEERRFGGSIADLMAVKKVVEIPVLRKDFIVTEYQVIETRVLGADLLLLIVAALSDSQLMDFHTLALELGLSVLVEVHNEEELERALTIGAQIIGVNARNLKTLEIHQDAFNRLLPLIPNDRIKVAESGIATREQVINAQDAGATAILVGETLVRAGDPSSAIKYLLGR